MVRSLLQNEDEFRRWYLAGRAPKWIVAKYRDKYGIEISSSTIGNWRVRLGLPPRQVRDVQLIPWTIARHHRNAHDLNMLRQEARRRAGDRLMPRLAKMLGSWKAGLAEDDAVVHYDPDTREGWFHVPRRHGIDKDLIRVPDRPSRQRGTRDV